MTSNQLVEPSTFAWELLIVSGVYYSGEWHVFLELAHPQPLPNRTITYSPSDPEHGQE
jgi:hypothetical protein